ncbi:MAG: hypothetical protein IK020_11225 [Clostridiales bacterium]|nr:hypothetical protein [Clostridiales bacterium]
MADENNRMEGKDAENMTEMTTAEISDIEATCEEIVVEGEDTGICADGYGMVEITTKKLSREKFRAKFAFHADFQLLQDILAGGGRVFGLRKTGFFKDGPIEVVFTLRISENSYNCDRILFSDGISEASRNNIRKHVRLEVARLALSANCHDNTFLGEPLPELVREVGSPNWIMGVAFAFLYGICLRSAFGGYVTSMCVGISMGIAMSLCFRSVKYHFKNSAEQPDAKTMN